MQNNRRKYFPANLKRNSIKNNHIDDNVDGECGDGSSSVYSHSSLKCQLFVANELNGNNTNNNNRDKHRSQFNSLNGYSVSNRSALIDQQQQQPVKQTGNVDENIRQIQQSFDGDDPATDGYTTADYESALDDDDDEERKIKAETVTPTVANGSFLRQKFPAYKYKVKWNCQVLPEKCLIYFQLQLVPRTSMSKNSKTNFRFSSYSDDEDVKEGVRERRKMLSKSKAVSATSMPTTTPVAVAQQVHSVHHKTIFDG